MRLKSRRNSSCDMVACMSQPDIVIFLICSLHCIVSIVIILRFLSFFILSKRNKLELWRIISSSTSSGNGDPHKFLAGGTALTT